MSDGVPADQPIAVTLSATQWRMLLNIMADAPAPLRVTWPLFNDIERQCGVAVTRITHPAAARNNGAEEHPSA